MVRVGVLGAGVAGVAAALEAAVRGAQVTLFEGSGGFPTPKSAWPKLLGVSPPIPSRQADKISMESSIAVLFDSPVTALDSDRVITAKGRRHEFDAVVLATGSRMIPESFLGTGKTGAHLLASRGSFVKLAAEIDHYGSAAVFGANLTAVEVAERLHSKGLRVSILAPGGILPALSGAVRKVVLDAICSAGVRIIDAKPKRVVGFQRVEAIVFDDQILPCDAFVELPRAAPSPPKAPARLGRQGGVVVNDSMLSSASAFFAAGDCAEVPVGSTTLPMMSESSAETMGRVAGYNAAGGNARARVLGSFFMELFGIGVASSGLSLREAQAAGLIVSEVSKNWGGEMACSLFLERGSSLVIGVQLAGRNIGRLAETVPLVVSTGSDLARLAYHERSGSSDISPMAETAREALKYDQGSGLRPRGDGATFPRSGLSGRL